MKKLNAKKVFIWLLSILFLSMFESCSEESSTGAEPGSPTICSSKADCPNVDLQDDFILIRSSKKRTVLGTNSNSAKSNERPEMEVSFDYAFQLGMHEVTCGEYNALMGGKKDSATLECANDSLPAVNVTYYDAVLFANAKSKKEGKDTAYAYVSAEFDKKGHCVLLNGFKFNFDVDAYRLPTEAEWIFASELSVDVENSWNSENSDFAAHEVCRKKEKNGFCDLSGNVTEWVNDWLGAFRDTSVTNYMGAPNGGTLDERVIKGGNFRSEPSLINLHSRGDVYTVTSASYSDYLGFRLAYGKIENPVWFDASGNVVLSNILVLTNKRSISPLLGSSRLKMAFRNDVTGNLAFVDFSNILPSVVEIKDTINAYHPDISPDGKRVAFCTGQEGIAGKSVVYVRDLNEKGTNLVKLDVKSAAVPRWRVLENGDTAIVYVTDTGNNKENAEFFSQSTWQVPFAKGKFGKPVKLFDGAYHGGISDDEKLSVSGARLLRARMAKNESTIISKAVDSIWYDGNQACNASLNKQTKRSLFLDFSGETGINFVGKKYRTHERLFIADSTGKLLSSVVSPQGYTFDHSEWVLNHDEFAVVSLVNADGAHQKIALVNTKDGTITNLVEGNELWHPCFWTPFDKLTNNVNWSIDSVGHYFSEENQPYNLLSHKMALFWSLKDSVELMALGNSRIRSGFDPLLMSVNSINLSSIPCDMHCIHYLFKNYVLNQCPKIKYVVLSLDFDLWYNYNEFEDIEKVAGGVPGYEYDKNHNFYPEGVDSTFVKLVWDNASSDADDMMKFKGWAPSDINVGWINYNGVAEILHDSIWSDYMLNQSYFDCLVDYDEKTCESTYHLNVLNPDSSLTGCLKDHDIDKCYSTISFSLNKLKDIILLAKKQNITVIGIVFPISPYYKGTGAYGRHGMQRSHAKKIVEKIRNMAENDPNFIFVDENKFGDHDYPNTMAFDYDHLNRLGAEKLSSRIDSLIQVLEIK